MPTSSDIRQQFIDYFVQKRGHTFVPSSPVVPHGDATLMFANAGMNQFKDVFLGTGSRDYHRAANSQKCIRAGGKHNDLEDVGRDTYHHTFFEMLGNWSFGDYFKAEAIDWAWDLLVNVWGLDPDRLHATYFEGDESEGLSPDTEARDLWLKRLPPERVHPGNKKDNFWEMGDTGPCGPCSEIHIDRTPDKSGGPLVNAGDARVMEIWNLVFIQFNRAPGGMLSPLPAKHVDTGMGFERLCAVIASKDRNYDPAIGNYDTDVFAPIFEAIRKVTGARAYSGKLDDQIDTAYRVLADHIRALTFAIADGALPSNEGRGYVLRRILRRAARHGRQTLGASEPFMHRLVDAVVEHMGEAFPELKKEAGRVAGVIREEEEQFALTLDRGIARFDRYAKVVDLYASGKYVTGEPPSENDLDRYIHPKELVYYEAAGKGVIPGKAAFELESTFGFSVDLTQVMAEERGMAVDMPGYLKEKEKHQTISRGAGVDADARASLGLIVQRDKLPPTVFTGYDETTTPAETFCLTYRLQGHEYVAVEAIEQGDHAAVVVGKTPFYAEAGGQVGDVGFIENDNGGVFEVDDTIKVGDVWFHLGKVDSGEFVACGPNDPSCRLTLRVDADRRAKIMANHTATHIMNHKMRAVLGDHVMQKGSLVDEQRTRFDLSHDKAITAEELEKIERMVNHDIAADLPVYAAVADQADALKINGLRAVFGEKYPPRVRIVSIGADPDEALAKPGDERWQQHSIEFCGGTHLKKTGDAEGFVFVAEEAVAKGVRRVTAQTGKLAHQTQALGDRLVSRAEALASQPVESLPEKVAELTKQMDASALPVLSAVKLRGLIAELHKKIKEQEKQASKAAAGQAVEQAREIAEAAADGEPIIIAEITGGDAKSLRDAMDVIRKKRPESALLLGAADGDKCAFLAAVPEALIKKGLKAGDWVREVAKVAGGGGGGRPDMAQAGGKDPAKLGEALEAGKAYAAGKVGK